MKLNKFILLFALAIFIWGCGSGNVQTTKTTNKDLSRYDTFAYLPNSNAEIPGRDYNDEDVNIRVIEAINANMKNAGYELDRDKPDLLVLVDTQTERETETVANPRYARFPYRSTAAVQPYYNPYYYTSYNQFSQIVGYNPTTYNYEEGTIIIHLVDRKNKETVWKGIASDNIYDQTTAEGISSLVDQIFEEYPLNNR